MTGLRLERVGTGYHGGTVLHEVSLSVPPGQVLAVVGRNGAGKTTLVHTVAGLHRAGAGRVVWDGRDVTWWPAHRRARSGIALVPQGRRVFGSLTVAEHLAIAYRRRSAAGTRWTPAGVLELLPQLAARRRHRGAQLSGGEQQMLAIARALLTQPRLVLLDEPTEGLAPAVAGTIQRLVSTLAGGELAVLLTAPQPALPLAVADQLAVLAGGRVAATFDRAALRSDPHRLHTALSPSGR